MSTYTEKNQSRRAAYRAALGVNREQARAARNLRRALGGAFGTAEEDVKNAATFGAESPASVD